MAAFAKKPKIESRVDPLKLYIATMGYLYPDCEDGNFYPLGMSERERLKYYSSKFNSILINSTFFSQPKVDVYSEWLQAVAENSNFRFIISAPKLLTNSRNGKETENIWSFFWEGNDRRGGCKILHENGKLGCLLVEFPPYFCFSKRSISKLKYIMSIIPADVKCAAEFRHWSWWENQGEMEKIFALYPGWCISTPYVENSLVGCGWAGNLPSTRIQSDKEIVPIIQTTNFIFLNFYGTMGKYLGSYDDYSFLERVVSRIKSQQMKGVDTVYCSFSNTDSSYCFPLPSVFLMGISLRPKMKELPSHTHVDLPCCLHDAKRLGKVWNEIEECPYKTDEKGHIELTFSYS